MITLACGTGTARLHQASRPFALPQVLARKPRANPSIKSGHRPRAATHQPADKRQPFGWPLFHRWRASAPACDAAHRLAQPLRRLAKDWENLNRNALVFIKLASIRSCSENSVILHKVSGRTLRAWLIIMAFVYSLVRKGSRRDAGASQAGADERLNKGHPKGWRLSAGRCVAALGRIQNEILRLCYSIGVGQAFLNVRVARHERRLTVGKVKHERNGR